MRIPRLFASSWSFAIIAVEIPVRVHVHEHAESIFSKYRSVFFRRVAELNLLHNFSSVGLPSHGVKPRFALCALPLS